MRKYKASHSIVIFAFRQIQFELLIQIGYIHPRVNLHGVGVNFLYRSRCGFLVLVRYFTDKLFENILQRHYSRCPAVLIEQYRYVQFPALELVQQSSQRFCLRYKVRWPQFVPQLELVSLFADFVEQILRVNQPHDIINISFIYRETAVACRRYGFQNRLQIRVDLDRDNVRPWGHDFTGIAFA
jgi:hypothetical protein